jgi:hypothetical protein
VGGPNGADAYMGGGNRRCVKHAVWILRRIRVRNYHTIDTRVAGGRKVTERSSERPTEG